MTDRSSTVELDEVQGLRRQVADYAAGLEFLRQVPVMLSEAEAVDAILGFALETCGPRVVGFLPAAPGTTAAQGTHREAVIRPDDAADRPAVAQVAAGLPPGESWAIVDGASFAVRIQGLDADLGVLAVVDVAVPDRVHDHVNLMLALSRVIAMPIEHARIQQALLDSDVTAERMSRASQGLRAVAEESTEAPGSRGVVAAIEELRRKVELTGQQLVVVAAALDGLGALRVTAGSRAADQVAEQCGQRLRSLVRAGDAVGRLPEGPFVVAQVLDDGGRPDLPERIVAQLGLPFAAGEGAPVEVTAIVGLATSEASPGSGEALVSEALASIGRARRLRGLAVLASKRAAAPESWRDPVNATIEGVVLQDPLGQIVDSNPAAEQVLGLSRDALTGRSSMDPRWQAIHADGSPFPGHKHPAMQALASGRPVCDVLMGLRRPDAALIWLVVSALPLCDPAGRVTGAIAMFTDVTDTRRAHATVVGQLQRLRHSIDAIPNPFFIMDAVRDEQGAVVELTYVHANAAAARLYGCRIEDIVGRGQIELFPSVLDNGLFDRYLGVLESGRTDTIEIPAFDENGVRGAFEVVASRVGDSLVLTATEISARKAMSARLAASEARFMRAFGDASVPMALIQQGRDLLGPEVLQVNASMCAFLGVAEADVLGLATPGTLVALAPLLDGLADLVPKATGGRSQEMRLRHSSGQPRWGVVTLTSVPDTAGDRQLWLLQCADVTEWHRAEAELRHTTLHDHLTGLANRAMLLEVIAEGLVQARTAGTCLAVLTLDIDDFAAVNDGLGIEVGDAFLRGVATLLAAALQPGELLGRIGGDEFTVVLREEAPARAEARAEALIACLAGGVVVDGSAIGAAASGGLAIATRRSVAEVLVAEAGSAMHEAKVAGGSRLVLARAPQRRQARAILSIEAELRSAVATGGLNVRYQPVIDLASGRVVAVEALTRWMHPTRGVIPPEEFIAVAERRGIIGALGDWVLDTSCAQAALWRELLGDRAPDMAVNVSTKQLGMRVLPGRVEAILARHGLPPSALTVELTESQVLAASSPATAELRALHELGVRVAIDDFGTGFAGFEYLRRLPVDVLKVDRSFVEAVDSDPTDRALAAAMITLGRSLGLTVVAEGVEREAQLQVLRQLGAHLGQGWLWSPAVTAAAIAGMVELDEAQLRHG